MSIVETASDPKVLGSGQRLIEMLQMLKLDVSNFNVAVEIPSQLTEHRGTNSTQRPSANRPGVAKTTIDFFDRQVSILLLAENRNRHAILSQLRLHVPHGEPREELLLNAPLTIILGANGKF